MWDCDLHTSANGSWRAVLNPNPDMEPRKAEKNTAVAINSNISDSFNYEGYFGLCLYTLFLQNKATVETWSTHASYCKLLLCS
jgi:hypothetical protein